MTEKLCHMKKLTKSKCLRVNEDRRELYVEHGREILTFICPAKNSGYFADAGRKIDADSLERPTMAQTASLVYAAWQNPKERYSAEFIRIIKNRWLHAFNGVLYVPNKGAYIQDNPKTENFNVSMDLSELEKMLKEGDPSVRFVPFGYKTGEQSALDLEKNPFVIALASKEGAEKLAYVANKYPNLPYVRSFENFDELTIPVSKFKLLRNYSHKKLYSYETFKRYNILTPRVAALGSDDSHWSKGGRLDIVGNGLQDFGWNIAFGVSKKSRSYSPAKIKTASGDFRLYDLEWNPFGASTK